VTGEETGEVPIVVIAEPRARPAPVPAAAPGSRPAPTRA